MSINLNAFPLIIPHKKLKVCIIPFDTEQLRSLREEYQETHVFRRMGGNIQIFSSDGEYPISGEIESINLVDDYSVFCFLVKEGIKRHLASINRHPFGFSPIELISTKKEDNLLAQIISEAYPFQIFAKYRIDTRIIHGKPCLIIDSSTRTTVSETCQYFTQKGFDLANRFIVVEQEDHFRKLFGRVIAIEGEQLHVRLPDESVEIVHSNGVYLEASRKNIDDYILFTHGSGHEAITQKIRLAISSFNGGKNKNTRINALKKYLQSNGVDLIEGTHVDIGNSENVQNKCGQLSKPVFVFNDNGEVTWTEQGFTKYGPYTKRTFDRNDPSICVICGQHDKGRVEQFIRKFLKGIPRHNYFANGLEGKFSLGTSQVKFFVTANDDVEEYMSAIKTAIQTKSENGGRWDLALIQIRESFKKLDVKNNPYYLGKSLFFLHQVPVQDFTIELLDQQDSTLGYSLNNMALACYAKMGGVPWLLKSSPTLSHELVIGIGSANVSKERGAENQRIMGITTVFSGDGSYIVSNTSKAVLLDAYPEALSSVLNETIEKIQKRMNWQKGDTIRLVFHASVKKFNRDEIHAVKTVIDKYRDYQIEYAFLKISEDHGLHLFDSSTANEKKGQLAPMRGKTLNLSRYEMLVYLIGQREMKRTTDGHPRGIILNIHKDSTFKDIKYLSSQLYNFASHSWRSFFPNSMPVTISYSDLIARKLGWLNQLPSWNDSIMIGKIGHSQWFL